MALPRAEQTRQLMAMIDVRVEIEKGPVLSPAKEPQRE
jgi:hypothetical protein